MEKLVEAELLFEQGDSPSRSYRFKHALIQDAAYQSLVRSSRQHYHRKIAETLKERFPDVAETQPEILAHHYASADLREAAIPYSQGGGREVDAALGEPGSDRPPYKGAGIAQRACRRVPSAFSRSLRSSSRSARLSSRPRASLLPRSERSTGGRAKSANWPATRRSFFRCGGDCGSSIPHAPNTGRRKSLRSSAGAWARPRTTQDLLMLAHHAAGVTLSALGQHSDALKELEQAIAIHDPERHASTGVRLWSGFRRRLPIVRRRFRYGSSAIRIKRRRMNEEAVALAERLQPPLQSGRRASISPPGSISCVGDSAAAQTHAEEAIAISTQHDFVFWLLTGMILRGWALTARNQVDEGLALMRQALAGYEQTGAGILAALLSGVACGRVPEDRKETEALQRLDEAEAAVQANDERWWEAELYRLKGELTLKQPRVANPQSDSERIAEAYFDKARRVASDQGAKSLELRAAISLGRLWMKQGKIPEAKRILGETYGWFTEGFDLPDLQEAKTLLEV